MGCACLRGDGHRRFVRRAGGPAAGGRQQGGLARQPDAARPDARSQLLRRRSDADAIRLRESQDQPDADPNPDPDAVSDSVGVGQPIGDRDRQRFCDAMPIAVCDADAVSVADAQWQRETLDLALSQAPTRRDPAPGGQDRRSGPVVSASSQRITVLTGRV
ncbi:MAG TPA: hypothetical protein VN913_01740 [Candidatus Binatus sp.]|nr:hypothetical protein [Candidatus Binatus sp.]